MSKFKFLMNLWYKELLCNIKNEILISGIFCWYQHWKGITEMLLYFLKKNSYSDNKKVVVFQLPNLVSLKFLCLPFFCAYSEKFFHHDFWTATKLSFSDPTSSQKVTPVHIGCVIIQMEYCAIHFKNFWENLAPMSSIIDWNSNRQVSSTHRIGSTQYILDKTFYTSIWIYEV